MKSRENSAVLHGRLQRTWAHGLGGVILVVLCLMLPTDCFGTNVSGNITTNTVWTLAGSPYNLTGSVYVNSGATLTIESGVQVNTGSSAWGLNVNSGGALVATNVTFNLKVYLNSGAVANLSGNTFYSGGVIVAPSMAVALVGNNFPPNSTVNLMADTLTTAVTLPQIPNVSAYVQQGYLYVDNGGTLNIASGCTLSRPSSSAYYLTVNSGGTLVATNATFSLDVILNAGAVANLSGNRFNNGFIVNAGAVVNLSGNTFPNNGVKIVPSMAVALVGNNFPPNATVNLMADTLTIAVTLPQIPNVITYNLSSGSLYVGNGGTLSIASGYTITTSGAWSLTVNSGGTLVAVGVTFFVQVILNSGSAGTLEANTFKYNGYNYFDRYMSAIVTHNDFSASYARAQGSAGGTINLRGNYWGSTDPAWIAQNKIYDFYDNSSLPIIDFGAPLASARNTLLVTPSPTASYGSLLVNTTRDLSFTVKNVGSTTLSGAASNSGPFAVVGDASYTLGPGQVTTKTIRYAPTAAGSHVGTATFTGGNGATVQLTGSAYNNPVFDTGAIAGQVTRLSDGTAVKGATVSVSGNNSWFCPQIVTGSDGSYTVSGLPAGTQYSVTVNPPLGQPLGGVTSNNVTVVAGQTRMVNLALPSASLPPEATPENTPVVLVRGYGPVRPWAEDDSNSWSWVRSALETNGFANVWDCNETNSVGHNANVIIGTNGIADNACRLNAYLRRKSEDYKNSRGYYPPKIHLVGHSMGGLIVRDALGDRNYFKFGGGTPPLRVGKVIMLATPHCGSPVADEVDNFLGKVVLGMIGRWDPCHNLYNGMEKWGSMNDLATTKMRQYNVNKRWPNVALYIVFGSNARYGYDKVWNTCTDWGLGGGMFIIIPWNKKHGIAGTEEDINDGAVTKPSANGIYWTNRQRWIYGQSLPLFQSPYPVISIALNPVQSVSDLELGLAVDHLYILKHPGVTNWIVKTLLNSNPEPTPIAGSGFAVADATLLSEGSETQKVMHVFESLDGTVPLGAVVSVPVTSDAETTLRFELWATDAKAAFRLTDPFGRVIDAHTPLTDPNVQYTASTLMSNLLTATFTIANPTAGVWAAVIDASGIATNQMDYGLTVYGDSNVGLIPQEYEFIARGQDVVLSCGVVDATTNPVVAVSNVYLTATVHLPNGMTNSFTLFDDGWRSDGAPNDGVYAALMTNVQQVGIHTITYRAYGVTPQGRSFQRVANASFTVSAGNGSIAGDPEYVTVDTDGDGYADVVIVKVWVNTTVAGNYILSGQLVDATGLHKFARTADFYSGGTGPVQVSLIFDVSEMRHEAGQGDYHIENMQLYEGAASGTAWLDVYRGSWSFPLPPQNPLRAWLAGYGLPDDGSADYADSDGDGKSNMEEYLAGTVPTSAASVLRTEQVTRTPSGFTIVWQAVPGKTYKVLYATAPGGPWLDDLPDSVRTAVTGETSLAYTDTTVGTATKRFYRIKVIGP